MDREQIVAAEEDHVIFARQDAAPAGKDAVDQPEGAFIGQHALQSPAQNFMVDARKELGDVALQNVSIFTRELLAAVNGAVRAFARAVGVTILKAGTNCGFFEVWMKQALVRLEA